MVECIDRKLLLRERVRQIAKYPIEVSGWKRIILRRLAHFRDGMYSPFGFENISVGLSSRSLDGATIWRWCCATEKNICAGDCKTKSTQRIVGRHHKEWHFAISARQTLDKGKGSEMEESLLRFGRLWNCAAVLRDDCLPERNRSAIRSRGALPGPHGLADEVSFAFQRFLVMMGMLELTGGRARMCSAGIMRRATVPSCPNRSIGGAACYVS